MTTTTTLTLHDADGEMALYDAQPETPVRAAVAVLQEAFGVNAHIEDVTRRFAGAGYRAVAPHLFHRTGDPVLEYNAIDKVMPHAQALTESRLLADLDAAVSHLSRAGFDHRRIGVVGFCMGGTAAFLAAVRRPLGAAVTFYGGGVAQGRFGMPPLVDLAHELQAPWLGLYGDLDRSIPVEDVESLRVAITKAPVPTEIVRYPNAGHGFHCDARNSYHEGSATDAWRRTLEWFGKHLGTD